MSDNEGPSLRENSTVKSCLPNSVGFLDFRVV